MTKQEKAYIKAFVDSEDMFKVIADYISNIPEPEHNGVISLSDFGAQVLAHRAIMRQVRQKFQSLRIDASSIEDYVKNSPE